MEINENISDNKSVADREDEGTWVNIKNAAGEAQFYGPAKSPVRWRVAGTYSHTFRKAEAAQRERLMRTRRANLTGEQIRTNAIELEAACVLAWEGMEDKGKAAPLTKDIAFTILNSAPWIRQDVTEAMNDHASFFPTSSAT